jgi:hypothetical protein
MLQEMPPDTKFVFMEDIRDKHLERIEAQMRHLLRKCVANRCP